MYGCMDSPYIRQAHTSFHTSIHQKTDVLLMYGCPHLFLNEGYVWRCMIHHHTSYISGRRPSVTLWPVPVALSRLCLSAVMSAVRCLQSADPRMEVTRTLYLECTLVYSSFVNLHMYVFLDISRQIARSNVRSNY